MNYFRLILCLILLYIGGCGSRNSYQTNSFPSTGYIQYDQTYSSVKKRAIYTTQAPEGSTLSYDGDFQFGKPNGIGEQSYSGGKWGGDRYKGQFKDNQREGRGTYSFYKSGDSYTGDFVSGTMHGAGIYTYADGRYFVGRFKDGQRDGNGSLYSAGGIKIADQIWKAGVLISSTEKKAPPSREAYISTPNATLDTQDIAEAKAKKCVRLGMAPGSRDYKICLATQK